jgi:RNA polymerase sigma-70 factor (ECF subfamily)
MTPREESIERDDWLAHAAALRRLAASLLRDEHEAEDLVQETWLRTQRSDATKSGPWYRTVLRNLARDQMRERGRRRLREHDAARSERMPSEEQVSERLEVARQVAVEVARLDEPYRTVIHLRYFEDLSPEEIARASGVPVETVRTRLRRGLETLRQRMDQTHGGRREAWALALTPVAARIGPTTGGVLTAAGAIMSTKLVIAGAAAVIVAIGLFFGASRMRSSETRARSEAPKQALEESELRTRIAGALAATREALPTPTASPASSTTNAASVEVRGTVVVEDEKGAEHPNESGTLTIAHFTTEQDAAFQEVAVKEGAWTTSIPIDRNFIVGKLVARDREAVLPESRPLAPGPDPIAVRGKWLSRGWLRVIDATTKQELSGIELRGGIPWRAGPQWTHPGDDARMKTLGSGGASPIELPDAKWLEHYWVHAPNHAWTRVDFDHNVGGQRTVELSPDPSSVTVTIVGGSVPEKACVRLYTRAKTFKESEFTFRMPDQPEHYLAAVSVSAATSDPVRIEGLQGGEFVAAVEIGDYEETTRIGAAPVDVPNGGAAAVTVSIDPSILEVPRTHLSGIIEVPEGLERGNCRLHLKRIGGGEKDFLQGLSEMSFHRGDERHLHWDARLVRTGDYDAMIQGIEHRFLIHAPGPGETQVTTAIPPLVTVVVEVVDEQTGAGVKPEKLQWRGPRLEGTSEFELVPLFRDPKSGRFQFVAPRGEVEVYCRTPGYREAEKMIELDGKEVTCTLPLRHATGIHILMREDGAAPEIGAAYFSLLRIVREDGAEFLQEFGVSRNAEGTRFVRTTGRYRIEFPPLEGFETIEPVVVDVRDGEVTDVTVSVKRKR